VARTVSGADRIIDKVNTEHLPASDLTRLRSFVQVIVNYVYRGKVVDVSTHPAKAAFRLMSRTSFSSMYRSLLTANEKALFNRIVESDAVLDELGLNRRSRFFAKGFPAKDSKGRTIKSYGPRVYLWLDSIAEKGGRPASVKEMGKGKGERASSKDLMSPPRGGSQAMGAFGVVTEKGHKDTGHVKFEARGSKSHMRKRPADQWIAFAQEIFESAAKERNKNRPKSTELRGPPEPSK
jgi:hypothetical protein